MERLVSRWWMLALRGVLGILIGILVFVSPFATLWAFIFVFGLYMLVDGISSLIGAFSGGAEEDRWWLVLDGLAGIIAALVALFMPGIAAITILYLIAAWAIASGIFKIVQAVRLRKLIEHEWMLGASGVLSVVLGIALFALPGAGMVAWAWTIGVYALLSGVLMLVVAFRLRALGQKVGGGHHTATLAH